jgi:methylmalonyl-CoA mutase
MGRKLVHMKPRPNPDVASWQRLAQKELNGLDIKDCQSFSWEDLSIKPLYTSQDLPERETLPGFFPYTRGIKATMYKNRPWTIRQYAGFASAKESNAFYRKALASGQRGLSVAFDLPTHRGYDSDDPLVVGDVGKAGVAIDSVIDMHELFDGIDLKEVSVSMTMNGAVLPILAAFLVVALEKSVKSHEISGTIQNDILKEFMVRNTFIHQSHPCALLLMLLNIALGIYLSLIPSVSVAITFMKQEPMPV